MLGGCKGAEEPLHWSCCSLHLLTPLQQLLLSQGGAGSIELYFSLQL